jgi:hypothetical protein
MKSRNSCRRVVAEKCTNANFIVNRLLMLVRKISDTKKRKVHGKFVNINLVCNIAFVSTRYSLFLQQREINLSDDYQIIPKLIETDFTISNKTYATEGCSSDVLA